MSRQLYALLVGINQYPDGTRPLQGCVADVNAVETYLHTLISDGNQLHTQKLLNQDATRQKLIDTFRSHLRDQATKDDVVLFYYSGHGSQEPCPPAWMSLDPDGRIETLVCYDSRKPGGNDLADKELGQLIREVSACGAHVLVILDSCHSGSGTRDFQEDDEGVRLVDGRNQPRPIEQFLVELHDLNEQGTGSNPASGWRMTPSPHILLAACEDRQTARERPARDGWGGLFTRFLIETLQTTNRRLTYQELLYHVQGLTLAAEPTQKPQLESFDISQNSLFLDGAVDPIPASFQVRHRPGKGWTVAAGAVQGLQPPAAGRHTELLIFPLDVDLRTATADQALTKASVIEVQGVESRLQLTDPRRLVPEQPYRALVVSLPLTVMEVCFEGDEDALRLVRSELLRSGPGGQPSLYLRENPAASGYRLLAKDKHYIITHPKNPRPVTERLRGYSSANAVLAVSRLEHIARWQQLFDLRNPNPRMDIGEGAIRVSATVEGKPVNGPVIEADYYFDGEWLRPKLIITIENLTDRELYCAVLGLQEKFAITSHYFIGSETIRIPPHKSMTTTQHQFLSVEGHNQGITESRNIYKIIVSTIDMQPRALEQGELPQEPVVVPQTTLEQLFDTLAKRGDSDSPRADGQIEDWTTRQLYVTVHWPLDKQPISPQREITLLPPGVKIRQHPSLQASARLISASQSERALDVPPLPRSLEKSRPLYFQSSRGDDSGLSVLELTNVVDYQVVTDDEPLHIDYPPNLLASDEYILAVAYDPELDCYLPLGHNIEPGLIQLRRLPTPATEQTKTPLGSLKIYFQKILGLSNYPRLCVVDIDAQGKCTYIKDIAKVSQRVAKANRITLYIHGIFGETDTMVFSAPKTNPPGVLYLAYDYENLNTPITKVAEELKRALALVKLDEQHIGNGNNRKDLRIVAHSLGGLVSRYLIEYLGGDKFVNHLVILGSPSAGTPLSIYEDGVARLAQYKHWSDVMLCVGMNINWPVATLASILAWMVTRFDEIFVTLDNVHPKSPFLEKLKQSTKPDQVRYTLIAGDTTNLWDNPTRNKVQRILTYMQYQAFDMLYFNYPNDIAMTVESVFAIDWVTDAEKRSITCDHTQYFSSETSQQTQREVLA